MAKPFVLDGERYEAEVPDTLDLAERAGIAVNALSNMFDPKHNYALYMGANFSVQPPYMVGDLVNSIYSSMKLAEALLEIRIMSGNNLNFEVDEKVLTDLIANIDDNGMFWTNVLHDGGPGGDRYKRGDKFVSMWAQMHAMLTLASWYQVDHDPEKKKMLGKMAEALAKIAIYKDDYAYYPYVSWCDKGWKFGWENTNEPGLQPIYCLGKLMAALSRWYTISGDEKALDLANKLKNFLLKPKFWAPKVEPRINEIIPVVSAEHGHWGTTPEQAHFHSQINGISYMLEYAIAANDARLKEFIREFYEYTRNFGIARIGFFYGALTHGYGMCSFPGNKLGPMNDEGCGVGDMTILAIKLCDACVGDYWEDVDCYVRNHLVEHQLLRRDLLEDISKGPSKIVQETWMKGPGSFKTTDRVIEKQIGSFASLGEPTIMYASHTHCCSVNDSRALYYAWEATVRCKDGVAQVNLLLNRASPWLDVDSYLPYEGKVVIKNKTSKKISVRIPLWTDKNAVKSSINGKEANPFWLGNYLVFDELAEKDIVTIEFPMVETVETYTEPTAPQKYTCHFKGNTLIDISPRENLGQSVLASDEGTLTKVEKGYPLYLRDHYKQNKAPMKKVTRFIPHITIKW